MSFEEALVVALAGAVLGALIAGAISYRLGLRTSRRQLQSDTVRSLEEALTEMRLYAQRFSPPWFSAQVDLLLDDGDRALTLARPRLGNEHVELYRRMSRAMGVFAFGRGPVAAGHFHACFDAYADAAFAASAAFYANQRFPEWPLPTGREIQELQRQDPTLGELRRAIGDGQ